MRHAPPVHVPVGRFVWGVWLTVALALTGAGLCLWATRHMDADRVLWMGAIGGGCAVVSWLAWHREWLPEGALSWDGQAWWFHGPEGAPQAVEVTLGWDAGFALLLRLRGCAPRRFWSHHIWLRADRMAPQWHALRCAVYARDTL